MTIRTDCYLAILNKMKLKHPSAVFIVVTNAARMPLSPPASLLVDAGIFIKPDGTKNPKMDFQTYKQKYIELISANPKAVQLIEHYKMLSKEKDVFFVCVEKDASICHRSILKEMCERDKV